MAQQVNQNKVGKSEQQGQFNQKNGKGMTQDQDTKNLKSGRISDADALEDEDTSDASWNDEDEGSDEDLDIGSAKKSGSKSKKH